MRAMTWMMATVLGAGLMAAGAAVAAEKDKPKAAAGTTASAHIAGAGDHKDKVAGHLVFEQVPDGVKVTGQVTGLTPGKHGFHVHEKADLSDPKLVGAGGHFNPSKGKHGGPDSHDRHAGDFGNITADDKGVAKVDGVFKGVTINGKDDGIVGRSVIIHAKEDDLKTDPSGNSGDRIAGGKIEFTKERSEDKKDDAKK